MSKPHTCWLSILNLDEQYDCRESETAVKCQTIDLIIKKPTYHEKRTANESEQQSC